MAGAFLGPAYSRTREPTMTEKRGGKVRGQIILNGLDINRIKTMHQIHKIKPGTWGMVLRVPDIDLS